MNLSWFTNPESWIALVTLVVLELVLGVDNIIFISILAGKLPKEDQARARTTGIMLAVITRSLLLLSLYWLIKLDEPLFTLLGFAFSGHNLILIAGGLFLLYKSTSEIHEKLEGQEGEASARVAANFASVIIQIMLLDIIFSLDSVITAVGMSKDLPIMIIAVILAALVMIFAAGPIGDFVESHPTVKMLALSFLLMVGLTLIAGGFGVEVPKGYVYFAMGFSVFVEMINLRVRDARVKPVNLRHPYNQPKIELQPALASAGAAKRSRSATKPTPAKASAKPKSKKK